MESQKWRHCTLFCNLIIMRNSVNRLLFRSNWKNNVQCCFRNSIYIHAHKHNQKSASFYLSKSFFTANINYFPLQCWLMLCTINIRYDIDSSSAKLNHTFKYQCCSKKFAACRHFCLPLSPVVTRQIYRTTSLKFRSLIVLDNRPTCVRVNRLDIFRNKYFAKIR